MRIIGCLFRPAHVPAGRTVHAPSGTGPHAALSSPEKESGNFGGFVLALQALAATLHRGDELRKVDLERAEDLIGIVLGAEPDLALACPRVLDDVLGGALGLLGDLLLANEAAPGARGPP